MKTNNIITETSLRQAYETAGELKAGWQSPSNIALVKYWGKAGDQVPLNPSLSMTLSTSVTQTKVLAVKRNPFESGIQLRYVFDGIENPAFQHKISAFLEKVIKELPFLREYAIEVESSNTFPHSAGIASSASSMSALALCLVQLDNWIMDKKMNIHAMLKKVSHIARLGSGSACRSVYGNYVLWGKYNVVPKSSNKYAIPLPVRTHQLFARLHDSILIIDKSEKAVSSRAGHALMNDHPFRKNRLQQAEQNTRAMIKAISSGDWELFSRVAENEALTLHGLMMSSEPGFLLMKPNTIAAIEKINQFRSDQKVRITYTLDAGPNLHVLYPHEDHETVQQFINQELAPLCENNFVIHDQIGSGPVQIT